LSNVSDIYHYGSHHIKLSHEITLYKANRIHLFMADLYGVPNPRCVVKEGTLSGPGKHSLVGQVQDFQSDALQINGDQWNVCSFL
jgi:hypothetical protein